MTLTLTSLALLALAQAPSDALPSRPGPMDTVLLKDYRPDSSLKVPETFVAKASYPVIDVHAHTYARTPAEVAEWVRVMDEVGIELSVILTGATGQRFDQLVELYLKPYPNRFQLWCGIDTSNKEAPDYRDRAVRELVRCYNQGARGVGEITDKGSGLGRNTGFGGAQTLEPRSQRIHHDDPRLDPFWRKCAELKIPVNIHIADHPSAWRPPDARQERLPRYQVFNQYGKDVLTPEELFAHRDRLLDKHPQTTFIFCHLSNQGHDLAAVAKVLDRYPNLHLDIAARGYEIGRQPKTASRFLARYQDRLLFGTDMGREKSMYQHWWRLLETGDEYIPGPVWWRLYGLELPPTVLEKLYRANALRLLNRP